MRGFILLDATLPDDKLVSVGDTLKRLKKGAFGSLALAWDWLWDVAIPEQRIYYYPKITELWSKESIEDKYEFDRKIDNHFLWFSPPDKNSSSVRYHSENGKLDIRIYLDKFIDYETLSSIHRCGSSTDPNRYYLIRIEDLQFSDRAVAIYSGENDAAEFGDFRISNLDDDASLHTKGRLRAGRPEKFNWTGALMHLIAVAHHDGLDVDDEERAAHNIRKMMEDWFMNNTETEDAVPKDSVLKAKAGEVWVAISKHEREREQSKKRY